MARDQAFFVAGAQRALYRTDGTPAGTVQLAGGTTLDMVVVGNRLFFTETTPSTSGYALWVSDGTTTGTTLVRPSFHLVRSMVAMSGRLFFVADDGTTGHEPWFTDGSALGTALLRDIHPTGSSGASPLVVFNQTIYFAADDGVAGTELWASNGSAAGTRLFADIEPGPVGSNPGRGTTLSAYFAFHATDAAHGRARSTRRGRLLRQVQEALIPRRKRDASRGDRSSRRVVVLAERAPASQSCFGGGGGVFSPPFGVSPPASRGRPPLRPPPGPPPMPPIPPIVRGSNGFSA